MTEKFVQFLQQDLGVLVAQFELAQRHIQETPHQLYGLEAVKKSSSLMGMLILTVRDLV